MASPAKYADVVRYVSTDYDASLDYFPAKARPDESDLWDVEYFNSYKV